MAVTVARHRSVHAKAGAFDADGAEAGATEVGYPLLEPQHGWAVQEPDEVVAAGRAAASAAPQPPSRT
ncbi:MAG TPA: hypothetical protein VK501_11995 [Baekduia sp.]|uniref:hypothetical protein n=1 Tax=Baekduia sp. TaxID=2600305 RepID=UPI002B5B23CE|nr:hypothetical protein [Baekduia sp.]HMJ34631.1 hypothetical protein [Baekduia sp.]